jgi:acyl-CoA dehydrogenase
MPHNSSLEVARRIDAWWGSAKGDVFTEPFAGMAAAGLFQIGLPGASAALDSYRAIAAAEQAIAAKTGLPGLASAFAARQVTARFFMAGFASEDQRSVWLPRMASGEICASIAISETSADRGGGARWRLRRARPQGLGHQWPGRGCVSGAGGDRHRA